MDGAHNGSVTLQKTWGRLHPSINAASSTAVGRLRMNAVSMNTPKPPALAGSIRAYGVSSNPNRLKITYSGMSNSCGGIIMVVTIPPNTRLEPRTLMRVIAKAVIDEKATTTKVVAEDTKMLLTNHSPTGASTLFLATAA